MTAPRLPEVVARVVAWHNRHPLARRIDASQVHSIGEVRLPFASAEPWGDAPPPAAAAPSPAAPPPADKRPAPTLAEALAQRQARHAQSPSAAAGSKHSASARDDKKADAPPAADDAPAPEAAAAPSEDPAPSADDDRAEAALMIPLLDGDDGEANQPPAAPAAAPASAPGQAAAAPPAAAPAEPPDDQPAPPDEAPTSALARAVERRAAARASGAVGEAPADAEAATFLAAPAPVSRWRRLVDAVRRLFSGRQPGLPPLRAVFSEDFAWPLRPGAVARWAQRHGRPEPLAPLDWPRRSIDIEPTRLARHRGKGFGHDLPLHVLTAAIGVGDRRIRVLVAADGSIIGPRALDRQRSAAAATLLGLGLVALGWTLRPLHAPPPDRGALMAAAAATAASAASAPPMPASAASAADHAPSATVAAASAPGAGASAAHAEPAEAHAANSASAPEPAASEPPGDIRPVLTDEQKYAAKVEAAKLRGEPPPPPPEPAGPVYAVISPGSPSPDVANRSLALMRAAAEKLDGGAPAHGELINSHGQWRAAWWPFASLVDAERARVLLAGRGVKAEVVEF